MASAAVTRRAPMAQVSEDSNSGVTQWLSQNWPGAGVNGFYLPMLFACPAPRSLVCRHSVIGMLGHIARLLSMTWMEALCSGIPAIVMLSGFLATWARDLSIAYSVSNPMSTGCLVGLLGR